MGHFGTIMFLKLEIYILNWLRTCTSVDQIPNTFMFYVLLYLAKKFDGENAAEDARKYQSEGGVVRNSRNNQERLV